MIGTRKPNRPFSSHCFQSWFLNTEDSKPGQSLSLNPELRIQLGCMASEPQASSLAKTGITVSHSTGPAFLLGAGALPRALLPAAHPHLHPRSYLASCTCWHLELSYFKAMLLPRLSPLSTYLLSLIYSLDRSSGKPAAALQLPSVPNPSLPFYLV